MMRNRWTDKDVEKLKNLYPDNRSSEVARILCCGLSRVYNKAFKLGLKKTVEYLNSDNSGRLSGRDTRGLSARFKKGHIPANKGKKWTDYLTEESIKGCLTTTFKNGNIPHNTKRDSDITIRNDEGRKYKYIRLSKREWLPLHVYLWEKENGKVPRGMIVVFKDRNSMNCELSNLEMITREENINRYSFHRYPADLKFAIIKLNQLKRRINGKEQNSRSAQSSL